MIKLILSFASVLMTFALFSQNLPTRSNPSNDFRMTYQDYNSTTRAAGDSCGYMANAYLAIDKIQSVVWWDGPFTGGAPGIPGYSNVGQYFTAPQEIKISGFQFIYYIQAVSLDSIQVVGTIYQALADSTPGAEIGRDTIWVSEKTPGSGSSNYGNFYFDNEPTVSTGGFFLSTRIFNTDSIYFLSNDVGQMEDLSYYYYDDVDVPSNSGWGSYLDLGAAWDFDHLFFPIFKMEFSNDFTLSDDTICRGSNICVDLIDVAAIINDSLWNRYSYNDTLYLGWNIDGAIGGSTMRSYCDVPSSAGNVTVTMMDTINFFNDVFGKCPVMVSKLVNVVDSITVDFTFTNTGLQVDFVNTSMMADTYLWDFGDSNSNNDTNTTNTYSANGMYTVHLKAYNQCFEDSSIQVVDLSTVGIEEFSFENFNLYPNPTQGIISITSDIEGEKVELSIVNILGEVLMVKTIKSNFEQINMNEFGQGTYFFRLISNDKSITRKVVVQ